MNRSDLAPFVLAALIGLALPLAATDIWAQSSGTPTARYGQLYANGWCGGIGDLVLQRAQAPDIALTADPAFAGRQAIRVQIRRDEDFARLLNGSPRAEFTLPPAMVLAPGHEYQIRWRTFLPPDFTFDHQQIAIITQIHQGGMSGPPPFMLTLVGGDYAISVRGGGDTRHGFGPAVCCAFADRGRWVDWTLIYAPDAAGTHAVTRLYKDGMQVLHGDGRPNAYPDDAFSYLKFGVYKPGWQDGASDVDSITLYFGELSVSARKRD